MKGLDSLMHGLDKVTELTGKLISWCAVLMVVVTCYIVISRYVFNSGSIALQESVIYLNALLFLLAAPFTLKQNGHVRVDIFYNRASSRYKAWVDLLGSLLLLLPVSLFILFNSWDYVASSWAVKEQSGDTGGLPIVYLLKSLIPLMCLLLISQGVAEIIRNLQKIAKAGDENQS